MSTGGPTAGQEWRSHFMLPVAALMGYSVSVIHIYGINPYILPVTEEFGWTRAQFTGAFTFAILVQALGSVGVGMLVDRFGSRRLGLAGVILLSAAFALLGTATGSLVNWYALWALITLAALAVQATVWTGAVASRFTASRGMALAVTLCGASVAQYAFPQIATRLIADQGWRIAFPAHAALWLVLVLPLVFGFFRGAKDESGPAPAASAGGLSFRVGLRSTVYLRLLLASLCFTFTVVGLNFQFIPILSGWGFSASEAAGFAALIGLASIAGRLGTGWLIDHFRAARVGAAVFLLPVIAALLLLFGREMPLAPTLSAILLGLTLGSEVDVIAYLTARFFGLASFGALYGGMLAALSLGTAFGPLLASRIFDQTGGYLPFYWLALALLAASSLALFSLPRPPEFAESA